MVINPFIGLPNTVLVSAQRLQKQEIKRQTTNKNKPFYWLLFFVVLVSVGFYTYNQKSQINEQLTIKEQRFEQLVKKLKSEELTNSEWAEVCELLAELKHIYISDCADCQSYITALLGGKHAPHLTLYLQKTSKEIEKGIKSYQKQIDEHLDKIANPRKHIPEWDDLDPRNQKNLQEKKWHQDIKRLKEQKEILECILKNK